VTEPAVPQSFAAVPAPTQSQSSWGATPQTYRLPIPHFELLTLLGTTVLFGVFWVWARTAPLQIPYLVIAWVFLGLGLTLVGMGWAAVIALADDPVRGLLFACLPPYVIWYSCTRWRLVSQPMTIFLSGIALCSASLWAGLEILKAAALPG